MTSLSALWLPILLSAVFVFIASSVLHMATPWHKNDYRSVPQEEQVTAALRPLAIPPGDYMVPRPKSMEQMRSPEFAEQMRQGPVLVMTVLLGNHPLTAWGELNGRLPESRLFLGYTNLSRRLQWS